MVPIKLPDINKNTGNIKRHVRKILRDGRTSESPAVFNGIYSLIDEKTIPVANSTIEQIVRMPNSSEAQLECEKSVSIWSMTALISIGAISMRTICFSCLLKRAGLWLSEIDIIEYISAAIPLKIIVLSAMITLEALFSSSLSSMPIAFRNT